MKLGFGVEARRLSLARAIDSTSKVKRGPRARMCPWVRRPEVKGPRDLNEVRSPCGSSSSGFELKF
ncbi:MAG: hypothetical protein KAJ51_03515 [Thermoplasmata archaeon]|nr:hypothetical protein [Thermoplasmata archaeon]